MTTITKERLLTIKQWRETYGPGSNVVLPAEEAEELARIALASLEAEPVGTFRKGPCGYSPSFHEDAMPLYAAPPAPVSLPDEQHSERFNWTLWQWAEHVGGHYHGNDPANYYEFGSFMAVAAMLCQFGTVQQKIGWNACRAAMLQAEPVSNRDELPLDYLQGHKDGLEWAAQLAEANHPQTGDWLYDDPIDLARAIRKGPDMPTVQGGNSPVIPNGWKLVPIDPTKDMLRAGQSVVGFWLNTVHCYSKMLAAAPAAPQQEAKNV